jgi:anti-anti-sigma factor
MGRGGGLEMTPDFAVVVAEDEMATVFHLVGELDIAAGEDLRAALTGRRGPAVFDLSRLTFIDARGVAAIEEADRVLDGVTVRNVSHPVRRVLEICSLQHLLDDSSAFEDEPWSRDDGRGRADTG